MKKYLFKTTLCAVLLFFGNACTNNFEDINKDPALVNADNLKPEMLLTWTLKNSIFDYFGPNTPWAVKEFSGYMSYEETGDLFLPCDCSNPFSYYRSYIVNMNELIKLVSGNPLKSNQVAIARIWNAFLYQIMTDAYGDIPYSEAAKDRYSVINQPKYESQQSIYQNLLKELKEASAALSDSPDQISFGNPDILFKGKVDSWRRFANSLRLRMALRIHYADPVLAKQHIQEAIALPLIENNTQNAILKTLPPGGTTPAANVNPVYTRGQAAGNPIRFGFPLSEVMLARKDPRLPIYATPATDTASAFKGRPIQLDGVAQRGYYSRTNTAEIGPLLKAEIADIVVMSSSEVYLIRAEAAMAGLSTENAEAMYQKGIELSMAQVGIAAAAPNYIKSAPVILSGTTEQKMEQIATQKYIALYPNVFEAWNEWRRTGYPRIWVGAMQGSTGGKIPRRMTYPIDEFSKNEANLREAIKGLSGGDELVSKVWWDKKPGLPYVHPKQGVFPPM
ncbi:SusD/RagB family nutrient-binding outer membrane lipoprotein [Dyadobacter sp. 32]|uniref:SusD/RagB family nutrient-binding outer membrane lipoprotein n=1 Tax=Dyadobacter sp. 32 TaxID=538966 RepID=UPI0011EC29C5